MTLFSHNRAINLVGEWKLMKEIGKVSLYIVKLMISFIVGICHFGILVSLGLTSLVTGIITILMPIFGVIRTFGGERIFVLGEFQVVEEPLRIIFPIYMRSLK